MKLWPATNVVCDRVINFDRADEIKNLINTKY